MIPLITAAEAARRLGCSERTLRRLRKAGEIRYLPGKGRGKVMVLEEDLDRYIKEKAEWEEKQNRQELKRTATAFGMSIGVNRGELSDKAYGQMIFKKRKLGSLGG